MPITKKFTEAISITEDGVLQYRRTVTAIDDDGTEIGSRNHRMTFTPGMALADLPPGRARKIANAIWDQETIDAWNAKLALLESQGPGA